MNRDWVEKDDIKIILKRYFFFDLDVWSDARKKVIDFMDWEKNISLDEAIALLTSEKLIDIWNKFGERKSTDFYGKFWVIENKKIRKGNGWGEASQKILRILNEDGIKAYAILQALIQLKRQSKDNLSTFDDIIRRISGESLNWEIMEKLEKAGIVHEYKSDHSHEHWIPEEITPVVLKIIKKYKSESITPQFSTNIAMNEFQEVLDMEKEFENHLREIMEDSNRIDNVINFGKSFNVVKLADYFLEMFGALLYFDSFLTLLHQFALTDSVIINLDQKVAGYTGFNLALFGAAGTGKTFSIDDIIRGNSRLQVPAHGLPGRNRYCGGMTAAKFIRMAEAYQDRKFNFIVPEFNDWFKYKGMVEPLKLAMEQREIRYEIKTETIGPYKFTSFFAVNYNTRVSDKSYRVTVPDPNFSAIEDRMLCRLHKMTKDRFRALRESQRKLRQGELVFRLAKTLRDHLTLVYAIQTEHPLTLGHFTPKRIMLSRKLDNMLHEIDEVLLAKVTDTDLLSPSVRLADRAIKVASASALLSYFNSSNEIIPIQDREIRYATQFYLEEMRVRSRGQIDIEEI
ncbi:MAG: hypothetical protein ACFFBD_22670 [Candidatus Hodarchaeota archaeon]